MSSDDWDGFKEHKREMSAKRRTTNKDYIDKVTGFTKRELTPYQIRFAAEGLPEFIDLYPTNQRYHNIITNERGHYKSAQRFLELQLERTLEYKASQIERNSHE